MEQLEGYGVLAPNSIFSQKHEDGWVCPHTFRIKFQINRD